MAAAGARRAVAPRVHPGRAFREIENDPAHIDDLVVVIVPRVRIYG
jgi:hypothetical protein